MSLSMLHEYFNPVSEHLFLEGDQPLPADCLVHRTGIHVKGMFPSFENVRLAILGVGEERGSALNKGCAKGADEIRKKLYRLKAHQETLPVIDLGNLKIGETLEDTYAAVATVVSELLPLKIIPVIIGGSQDLTYGQYAGFKRLEQIINIVSIDARFDLGYVGDTAKSESYLGRIILEQPNYLFNFSNIGYQTYFAGAESISLMKRLYFDAHRLGVVHKNIEETEPVVRSADLLTVDISAIRQSDAPGNALASPNGFYGEEVCQVMMYAGMSDKLSCLGLYEFNPEHDRGDQTAHLIAQMVWYFIEGVNNRKNDIPQLNPNAYITYRVAVPNLDNEIIFLKSTRSDRWWMKLPVSEQRSRYMSHHLMPCSYNDYEQACNNEVPDRWWNALQKLI